MKDLIVCNAETKRSILFLPDYFIMEEWESFYCRNFIGKASCKKLLKMSLSEKKAIEEFITDFEKSV